MISDKLDKAIREVPDFPKPGINFKDITTLLLDPELSTEIIDAFIERLKGKKIDAIWSTNSAVATGAADALKDAGFSAGEVLIVGIDFSDLCLKYLPRCKTSRTNKS